MTDEHAGCQSAYERAERRADFHEARLKALTADIHELAARFDGLGGNTALPKLDNKTMGGAVRALLSSTRTTS